MNEPARLGRGVFREPYLDGGLPVLFAMDSSGVVRKRLKVRPRVGIEQATTRLNELLDRVDPVDPPTLKLI